MEKDTIFHNRYKLQTLLGRGAYSEVWLASDVKTNVTFALKIFAPATGVDNDCLEMFAREFGMVVGVSGEHILKPYHYDSFEGKPYIVLPYCKGGSVTKFIGKTTEEEAWKIIHDVASGLKSLHSMNPPILHQDIKPANIMVDDNGHYLISDFGVSTRIHSTLRKTASVNYKSAGTHAYMGPERFSSHNTPVMASDVYSLGATIYELLTGDTPFSDEGGLLQKSGADIPELEGEYSDDLKKTLMLCLASNSWERPTTEQLIEISSRPHDITPNAGGSKDTGGNSGGGSSSGKGDSPDDGNTTSVSLYVWLTAAAVAGLSMGVILAL